MIPIESVSYVFSIPAFPTKWLKALKWRISPAVFLQKWNGPEGHPQGLVIWDWAVIQAPAVSAGRGLQ
jgi:hypothetical protein